MDLKWKMAMLSVRVHKFEQKAGRRIDFDKKESARFNKKKVRCYKCQQRGHFARECRAKRGNDKQRYSSFKIEVIGKFGGNAESKKMRKSMLKQEFSEFKIGEAEGLHKGYDRMQKISSQLNQLKAKPEDEDINLKFLRALPSSWSQVALTLKTKGYTTFSSSQSGPSHSAFVSATSASKKMSYGDSLSYSSSTTYSAQSNSKTGSHRSSNVIKDVLQSFVADTEPEQQIAYEDFEQIEKLDLEEIDLKWQMAMLSKRVHKFEQKARRKIDFDKKESARFNKKKVRCYKCQQRGHFARECRAKEGNDKQRYSSFKIKEIEKKEEDSKALIIVDTLVDWTDHDGESDGVVASKEFGMIAGYDTEDEIKEGAAKTYNLITGADSEEANTAGWDDSTFSVFTTHSKDVEGRPLFHRFSKTDSMKVVPSPLFGDYTSLSDHIDLDESQIDKSSEVNTNDFTSSDSSVKSSEHKPNDSTSCASTSSVSTSLNEAEIESNVGTPIQEPSIVQDLPSLSCNSFDKNEHTSRTSCNKNGYFNKKAGHFKKNASSVSKLCFVCGSGTRLIKDCDFYEKQMANKTVVLLKTGKVNIPPARPQPVPTGKPKVFAPVPTSWPNRPFLVSTDKGYSPSAYTPYAPTMSYTHMKYGGDKWATAVKPSAGCSWKSHRKGLYWENPFSAAEDEWIFDSGCSRSMTGNKERLDDFQEFQGKKVTFGGGEDTKCLVLSKDFKLPDDSMVVLRVPRKHNLYTINLNNLCPRGNLACLVAHALVDESMKWHRRMGHVNYKNMNRLEKGKQHKASYKVIIAVSLIFEPLQLLHMDLFGLTSIRSIDHKYYCLVITDDYSRVLVTRPHNKTPYALLTRNIPSISHFKPFRCHVTILNTSDHLGKFDGKADEGYIVGYSASNKAYRVYNVPNQRVEETINMSIPRSEPKDTSGDEFDVSPVHFADKIFQKELVRLKGQAQRATSNVESLGLGFANDAEEPQIQESAKIVPPGCIPDPTGNILVPPGSLPVPTGSIPIPTGNTVVSTDDVPFHSSTDSFFDDESTTRFSCPSDLGNHDPSPGIFSSSSYDDEFGTALNNVSSTVEVSPVATTPLKIQAGLMLCKKKCNSSNFRMYGFLLICLKVNMLLGLSGYSRTREMPGGLFSETRRDWTVTTPYEATKPKSKNESDSPVNVHLYRFMIGSLMYLTASRPDIMFVVSACLRNQVTPTTSNLESVKKIFKYLKGQPKLGLWYPKELPLVLEAYSDSDYVRANKDGKSTAGGCQFLGRRLISWQCKKQTIMATSSTEAEYVAAANCYGQPDGSRRWISAFQVIYMD
nr:uncharacterized mitochondrial protein AtMg00810-like [Tanacetum cinerariifolium]